MNSQILAKISNDLNQKHSTLTPVDPTVSVLRTSDVHHNFGAVRDVDGSPVVLRAQNGSSDEEMVVRIIRTIDPSLIADPRLPRRVWSPIPPGLVDFVR